MTGQYALRLGFSTIVAPSSSRGTLPLDVPSLAEDMKGAGYATGIVGKWHVGFSMTAALPSSRGWDKAFNYYTGGMDYYSKSVGGPRNSHFDVHEMGAPDRDERHMSPEFWSGFIWQERAESIVHEHASTGVDAPLFLYYALQTPHSPMQVPDAYTQEAPCAAMSDEDRRIFCGMVRFVDECAEKTHSLMREELAGDDLVFIFHR
jgi:arylsulfatase A